MPPPQKNNVQVLRAMYPSQVFCQARFATLHIPYPTYCYCIMKSKVELFFGVRIEYRLFFISDARYPSSMPPLQVPIPFRTSKVYNLQFILELVTAYDQDNSVSQPAG
jgi:hypothetical protein